MKVGAAFNPYKVFQGVFAPYWVLEHRGISTGAKLCYIRLLGFAGRDARCYPSVDTLGSSLGVSGRQARDYVKELERAALITVEQRGLRKTNVYLFLWTAELEQLINSVPSRPDDPDDPGTERPGNANPERNTGSAPDRNSCSGLDRNNPAVLDRKRSAGPIGINSSGKYSLESSSSSSAANRLETKSEEGATPESQRVSAGAESALNPKELNRTAQTIRDWAKERGIQRLRADRRLGAPEKEHLAQWAAILDSRRIGEAQGVFAVLDNAVLAAGRSGDWRHWNYLTLQIQLATERFHPNSPNRPPRQWSREDVEEEHDCDWAAAKSMIRTQVPEVAFSNWFAPTRQVERRRGELTVVVPDEPTRCCLANEYDHVTKVALLGFGIEEVRYVVQDPRLADPE